MAIGNCKIQRKNGVNQRKSRSRDVGIGSLKEELSGRDFLKHRVGENHGKDVRRLMLDSFFAHRPPL